MNQIVGHISIPEGAIIERSLDDSGAFERVRATGGIYPVTIDPDGTYYFAEVAGTRIAAVEVAFIDGRQQVIEDLEEVADYRTGLGCWDAFFNIADATYRGFPFQAVEVYA